jgi:hypothetical protein
MILQRSAWCFVRNTQQCDALFCDEGIAVLTAQKYYCLDESSTVSLEEFEGHSVLSFYLFLLWDFWSIVSTGFGLGNVKMLISEGGPLQLLLTLTLNFLPASPKNSAIGPTFGPF